MSLPIGKDRFGLVTVKVSEERPPQLDNSGLSKETKIETTITNTKMENKTIQEEGQLGFEKPKKRRREVTVHLPMRNTSNSFSTLQEKLEQGTTIKKRNQKA